MNAIRSCLLVVVVLLAGVFLVGACLRSEWKVERSIAIAAPPERVHAFVDDLENWPRFIPEEPGTTFTYGPTRRGAGAQVSWSSRGAAFELSILSSDVVTGLSFAMRQPQTGEKTSGTLRWSAEGTGGAAGAGTRVTWTESGDVGWNPIPRMLLPKVVEPFLGKVREQSLSKLKAELEAPAPEHAIPDAAVPAPR